jgi:hypothetical protein
LAVETRRSRCGAAIRRRSAELAGSTDAAGGGAERCDGRARAAAVCAAKPFFGGRTRTRGRGPVTEARSRSRRVTHSRARRTPSRHPRLHRAYPPPAPLRTWRQRSSSCTSTSWPEVRRRDRASATSRRVRAASLLPKLFPRKNRLAGSEAFHHRSIHRFMRVDSIARRRTRSHAAPS